MRHPDTVALNQIALFPHDALVPGPEAQHRKPSHSPLYDEAVLRYIGFYRFVTVHQVLVRFWTYAGLASRAGYRVLKGLEGRGLIRLHPLDPHRGRASRKVVELTDLGWSVIGGGARTPAGWAQTASAVREYRLQFAEVMLERNAAGWRLVREADVHGALRDATLQVLRGQALVEPDRVLRDRLLRLSLLTMPTWGLRHPTEGARIGLAARRGKNVRAVLEKLPPLGLFGRVTFELVSADPEAAERAREDLRRWAGNLRLEYRVVEADPFRARPYPAPEIPPEGDRFAAAGAPDPRSFLA